MKLNRVVPALTAVIVAVACDSAPRTDTAAPKPQAQQSQPAEDALIVMTVQSKYYASPAVKGRDIDVDAENGIVTLTGRVDTEEAKREAVLLAKGTSGVTAVEDHLSVAAAADRTIARSAQPEAHSPGWVTTKIRAQYYANPALKPWNIDVSTSPSGVVTLSGVVDNTTDRMDAVKIARGTEGVTRVDERLRVKGEAAAIAGNSDMMPGADSWITAKIQSRFFVDDEVKGRNIDVDTKEGLVTLRGTVGSYSERVQATSIARHTEGVRDVRDEMTIDAQPRRQGRDAVRGTKETVGTAGQTIEDAWITTKIQSKFFVDDQIKARNVNVDTSNGTVTLRGSVATEAAKKAAENLALETEGVVRVNNQVTVDAAGKSR
jgi:osmotically-inducible protein OsmY